jgi:hypothetical protein
MAIYRQLYADTPLNDKFLCADDPLGTQLPHPRIGRFSSSWRAAPPGLTYTLTVERIRYSTRVSGQRDERMLRGALCPSDPSLGQSAACGDESTRQNDSQACF